MDEFSHEQHIRNRDSRTGWAAYAPHREIVTRLILDSAPQDASELTLSVLGAGNCNDLDLDQLAARFSKISLVDVDTESVEEGLQRQGKSADDSQFQICGSDVSGILAELAELHATGPDDGHAQELVQLAEEAQLTGLPEPSGIVISTGLITQLVEAAIRAVGHDRLDQAESSGVDLMQAIRRRHLRLLSELTRPGGTAILVTEVVSSDTAPEICKTPVGDLRKILEGCLAAGNFFSGLHPGILLAELTSEEFADQFAAVQVTSPWLWDFTARIYAVVAFVCRRRT